MAFPIVTRTLHRHIDIDGLRVFYRESVPETDQSPVLLLLHGFPSASHQYRRLVDALGAHYRLIAPDLPGFGHSDVPASPLTFDRLGEVMAGFVERLRLDHFVMYVFDYGAPVGFRVALRHPERIAGLVVQNGNAYEEGLGEAMRKLVALRPGHEGEEAAREMLTLPVTRKQYEAGTGDVQLVSPDSWVLDQYFLDKPERARPQLDLLLNYHANLDHYPEWQEWLRTRRPPMLITWGANDMFFPEPGAHAYLRDVPDAELHVYPTGHFALEEYLPEIAPLIANFLDRTWKTVISG
ncbi:alpha/beta hydrolase [Herbidospora sp. NBRC 101105]|uniref:alpha/beta fold hydrolase n=1 Tax=Herbidospora sp. NBRC 101105 TaxID=3032195 RepID=UPI0024A23B6D|nr:alpha/beta hydrolase [Herbidospora sp. NBRC 101105]GLX92372.1 alpha/beta hydrolase [Herbidospora sp. NBRC 101105]